MAAHNVEIIVRPEDVGGNHRGVVPTMLRFVTAIEDVEHTLGVGIAKVGRVRRAVMNHRFVNGISGCI